MKHANTMLAALAVAVAMNWSYAGASSPGVPHGWVASGTQGGAYVTGFDPAEAGANGASVYIEGKDKDDQHYGALTQVIDARPWQGKRVRFSAMTRAIDGASPGEFWLRGSDGTPAYNAIASNRIASKEWEENSVVMMVGEKITVLELGVGLRHQGKIWIRDARLELAPETAAVPHRPIAKDVPLAAPLDAPLNLSLAP